MKTLSIITMMLCVVSSNSWSQVDQSDYYTLLSQTQTILRDRAKVINGRVGSQGYVEIGANAEVLHNVECNSNIFLRSYSRVYGNAVAGGILSGQAGASVDGDSLSNHSTNVPSVPSVGTITPGVSNIDVWGGQNYTLAPGNYNNVTVYSGATLNLSSGTYNLRNLTIYPDVTVYLDVSTMIPLIINTLDLSIFSRVVFDMQGSDDLWLVRINSTTNNWIRFDTDSYIKGIITCPNANVQIADRSHIDGAVHAMYVEVACEAVVNGINVDTDGDALPDAWEILGYDADNDGTIDIDLPAMGADPLHKDIFVEVDWMQDATHNMSPPAGAMNDVIQAFADADIENPDGADGITIHIELNSAVPFDSDMNPVWTDFDVIKNTNFDPNRSETHHYCIIGWQYNGGFSSGISRGIPASDFTVTLTTYNTDRSYFAGTFMHELGHNLNLRHGGADHERYKPNHLSIMNYSFQFLHIPHDGNNVLDYCRFHIDALDENDINEPVGLDIVAGHGTDVLLDGYATSIGSITSPASPIFTNCGGPIDWNENGDDSQTGYSMNLNPSHGFGNSVLSGDYHEWHNVTFTGDGTIGLGDTYVLPGTVLAAGNSFALECPEVPQN
jgi:hypothetical protein